MNNYDFKDRYDVSKVGVELVTQHLLNLDETLGIINVEDDSNFQVHDIDIIQITGSGIVNIEIKCDTYDSGNFFFETISNATKNTDGCFMYTTADYIYYFFSKKKRLYILPMPETREWFIANKQRFKEKKLATKDGEKILYYSHGYPVPIKVVMCEVDGTRMVAL